MSAPVFISHSSKDKKVALTICAALEARGLGCWIASRDVGPGEDFMEAIVHAIRSAKAMVLIFTGNANNSDEIKKEIVLATQNKLAVIPVRLEDVMPNDSLAYQFATMQWVDLFDDWEQAMGRLVAQIAVLPSAAPGQVPSTPPRTHELAIEASEPAIRVLPFWSTFLDTYRLASRDSWLLLRMTWQWLLLTTGIDLAIYWLVLPALSPDQKNGMATGFILLIFLCVFGFLLPVFIASVMGSRYLRFKLRDNKDEDVFGLKLDGGTANYFGAFAKLFLVFFIPVLVFGLAALALSSGQVSEAQSSVIAAILVVAGIVFVVGLFGASRMLLILPFKAMQRDKVTVSEIWRRTRHNNFPIFFATVVCAIPFMLSVLANGAASAHTSTVVEMATEVLNVIGYFLSSCLYTAFLYIAYRRLFGGTELSF